MQSRSAVWLVLAFLSACAAFGPKPFESDADYKAWLGSLGISGLTAQAATQSLTGEGFACQPTKGVIPTAPDEILVVCRRAASGGGCTQDQTVVLRLDWVGAMSAAAAPGMRVGEVAPALGKKVCD